MYEFKYKRLEALREITKLSPINEIRVSLAKEESEEKANELEYVLREKKLLKNYEKTWQMYLELEHDGLGLKEFAYSALDDYIKEKEIKRIRKK